MSRADEPAFPVDRVRTLGGCGVRPGAPGLTIREHFALELMKGLVSRDAHHHPEESAKHALEHTRALLAALGEDDDA